MITVEINDLSVLAVNIESVSEASVEVGAYTVVEKDAKPTYTGSYTVTPSNVSQTLSTAGMEMSGNVTINPIPSNYGKITYDGCLTIE